MMGSLIRFRLAIAVCCGVWAALPGQGATIAAEVDAKKISGMGVAEVLAELDRPESAPIDVTHREAIVQRAATLLLTGELHERGEYATFRRLSEAATPALASLTEEEQAQLEKLLTGLATEDAATFEQLQARVTLLNAVGKHDEAAVGAIEAWLSSRDLSLLDVDQVAWCLAESLPNRSDVKQFSVVWEGTIAAPRSGDYEFSTTPINVNREGAEFIRHSMAVAVGNVEVLRTPQKAAESDASDVAQWNHAGSAVPMAAQEPLPIRVEVQYDCARPCVLSSPSSIVSWQGPGLARQAIATSVLASPASGQDGLRAEFRWEEGGQPRIVVEEGTALDGFWSTPARIASQFPQLVQRLSDRLWQLVAGEEYLRQCEAGERIHAYLESPSVVGLLTSAQRQEFSASVMERPDFLQSISADQLLRLYRCFRFGAEEESIELLGQWTEAHRDSTSVLPQSPSLSGFFADNYFALEKIGRCLALQHPNGLQQLQDSWLEDDDGRCRLPAAKLLGFGFSARGELRDWIALLDEKLADEAVVGDAKVDWLLARAHAEELLQSGQELVARGKLRLSVGRPWLDEAELVAESDAVRQRVIAEQVGRFAGLEQWAAARDKLAQAGQHAAVWKAALTKLEAAARLEPQLERQRNQQWRLAELQRRRENAASQGNAAEAERYGKRIEALQAGLSSN